MTDPSQNTSVEYDRPSKSQVKRDMLALRETGKQLTELSADQLKKLNLPENIYVAVREAQSISSREGKRRQINYIGKLLRHIDASEITEQFNTLKHGSRQQTQNMHKLEALRDLLINNDHALTELLETYPATNIQQLRSLIRAARKEKLANEALPENSGQEIQRKHYRALYQALTVITTETK